MEEEVVVFVFSVNIGKHEVESLGEDRGSLDWWIVGVTVAIIIGTEIVKE